MKVSVPNDQIVNVENPKEYTDKLLDSTMNLSSLLGYIPVHWQQTKRN